MADTDNSDKYATKEQLNAVLKQLKEKDRLIKKQSKQLSDSQALENFFIAETKPSQQAKEVKLIEQYANLEKVKRKPSELFTLYLTNQFVFRGVNVRADELVSRGYSIVGGDQVGQLACQELIKNSGGTNFFRQLSVNTDVSGMGPFEKVYDKQKKKIGKLRLIHPVGFGFKRTLNNSIEIDANGEPTGYVQYITNLSGQPVTKDIPREIIEYVVFNRIGDEFTGLSLLQSGYNTIVRLMNMEESAANSAIKIANPLLIGMSKSKSPQDLAKWAQILGRVSGKDQVILPEGFDMKLLSPGAQNFNDYAGYFLDAVVAMTGVPKPLLLGGSEGSNRATSVVQLRNFYGMIRTNQQYVEEVVNRVFKEYGELAGFEAPVLSFGDIAEDADINAKSAIELYGANIITVEEARDIIGLVPSDGAPKFGSNVNNDLKNSDMKTFFPASSGKPAGSQKGIKDKQKTDVTSTVSPFTK